MFGAFRKKPKAIVVEDDNGPMKFSIGINEGFVVMNFPRPVASLKFDAEQTLHLSAALIEKATLIKKNQSEGSAQ